MNINVSIIEDNQAFLASFKKTITDNADLTLLSFATDCASGEALLTGAAADVLLVDLGLPDGSGLTLIEKASQCWPDCDVMVVSVFGNQENVLAALAAGATGYLLKDEDATNLAEQIRAIKSGGSPISPVIARQLLGRLNLNGISANGATQNNSEITLSAQEKTILTLASKGYNYHEVAKIMNISTHTVATHIKRCYRKLQVNSKAEAIYEARRYGLVKD